MGWIILALVIGFVVGSFFPQPELFEKWYNNSKEYLTDLFE